MKLGLAVVAIAGCASGGNGLQSDAAGGGGGDAKQWRDSQIEPGIDAPVVHPDAHPDARPLDARPLDAALPDACVPVTTELLGNPVFDLAPLGLDWVEVPIDPTVTPLITTDSGAQSAPNLAFLGGLQATDYGQSAVTDQLYQDVTVPANTTQLVITGYYFVATNETTTTTVYDTGTLGLIQTNGTPIEGVLALTNLTKTTAWTAFTHTFTANVSGQTVRVRMTSTNDITNATAFFFDTLSFKATHCP
jgi:hypothetical protein